MRIRRLHEVLMVLALVLGQWLTLAHAFQHPALSAADFQCQICLHAQGLDSGAAPTPLQPASLAAAQEAPQRTAAPFFPTLAQAYYPIRAPPILLS